MGALSDLPNYFLADLPPEASLNTTIIREACQTLRRNRGQYMASRSTTDILNTLDEVAAGWLQTDNPFRQHALKAGPPITGFSEPVLAKGLDAFFSRFTPENLRTLLRGGRGCVEA